MCKTHASGFSARRCNSLHGMVQSTTRQGRLETLRSGVLESYALGLGADGAVEVSAGFQHGVHDDRQLSGDGDGRAFEADLFSQFEPPGTQPARRVRTSVIDRLEALGLVPSGGDRVAPKAGRCQTLEKGAIETRRVVAAVARTRKRVAGNLHRGSVGFDRAVPAGKRCTAIIPCPERSFAMTSCPAPPVRRSSFSPVLGQKPAPSHIASVLRYLHVLQPPRHL